MSAGPQAPVDVRSDDLLALAGVVRPELHRYCSRLMGSVIDGEDVVQDTIERALGALPALDPVTPLRPWLFRIAHNRALDLLRGRAVRQHDLAEASVEIADAANPDPVETLMRQQAVQTAVSRFGELPVVQRSVVILKDILDESLAEIAALLNVSVDAVKGHLARGRKRLREVNSQAIAVSAPRSVSAATLRYVALFNARDWDTLRTLLADDVKLNQATRPVRTDRENVGMFFTIYATYEAVRLQAAWLEGREVIMVFESCGDVIPSYAMWLEWRDGLITYIHDYRYVRYVFTDAEWSPAIAGPVTNAE